MIQKITIRISEILSVRPETWVSVDRDTGKVLNRDFSKIIVSTNQGSQQILYGIDDDINRDQDLQILQEIIGNYNVKHSSGNGHTTINISKSSGVNIVSNSKNVKISQKQINESKRLLTEMKSQIENNTAINTELKEDITSIILEIEDQINTNNSLKRYTFRSLMGLVSNFASISSLGIELGKQFGFLL